MSFDPRTAGTDELLHALTVGDVGDDHPMVRTRFAADPGLHARWRELAATLAELRDLGADHRDATAGDAPLPDADVGAAAATVAAFRGASRSRRWWIVAAAAAAVALASSLWWLRDDPVSPPPDPHLGSSQTGDMSPVGPWPDGAAFSWPATPRAAGYRLHVRSPDGRVVVLPNGSDGELLPTNVWQPSPEQRAALPEHFEWRVVAFDANGSLFTSQWAAVHQR